MDLNKLTESEQIYIDNCTGLLQEVPENFDNGRTKVQLNVLTISKNFVVIGSECGALFIYNRNLNRTVKPLRTIECDPVTSLELYYNDYDNYLSVGRKSGQLIVMCLPSEKIRKIRQSIHDDIHSGKSITNLKWSINGRKLYSIDITGQVFCIDVDFDNEIYTPTYVIQANGSIREFICNDDCLFLCTINQWIIIDVNTLNIKTSKIIDDNSENGIEIIGCSIIDNKYLIGLSNGKIINCINDNNVEQEIYFNIFDATSESLPKMIVDGVVKHNFKDIMTEIKNLPLKLSHYHQYLNNLIFIWTIDKLLLINVEDNNFLIFDLMNILNDDLLEIISFIYDRYTSDIYLLTRKQQILRISTNKSIPELLLAKINNHQTNTTTTSSIMTSFMSSSTSILSKFSTDKLKSSLIQNQKLFDIQNKLTEAVGQVAHISTESGRNIANELLEQIKNSQLYSDFEGKKFDDENNIDSNDVDGNDNNEIDEMFPKKFFDSSDNTSDVIINRKQKIKLKNEINKNMLYGIDSVKIKEQNENNLNLINDDAKINFNNIEDDLFDDIMAGKFVLPKVDNVINESVDEIVDGNVKELVDGHVNGIIDENIDKIEIADISIKNITEDDEYEEDISNIDDDIDTVINVKLYKEEDVDKTEETLEEITKKYEKEIKENEYINTYELIEMNKHKYELPEYYKINNIANIGTDIWNIMSAPYTIKTFDVTNSYIIIIPTNNWRYYPRYRIFDVISNGLRGGGWSEYKILADNVSVNDRGNILWKIYKNKIYTPNKIEAAKIPLTNEWNIQGDHDKVYQASLTTKHGWYITKNGIFVQMMLPDMGILHNTDCTFKVNCIAASDHAVWALTENKRSLIARTGIDEQICPMGVDWVEDSLYGPNKFISIALYDKTGFGLDLNGKLWFINGVDEKNPLGQRTWYKCCEPLIFDTINIKKLNVNRWIIKVSSYGVFISIGYQLIISTQPITGHVIKHVIPERLKLHDSFSVISGQGNNGIFICQPNFEIFIFNHSKKNLKSIPHFDITCNIVDLASTNQRLYVLDNHGNIFIRRGFNPDLTPLGIDWSKIDIYGINSKICSITVSINSLWVVTVDGNIYIATENLRLNDTLNFTKIDSPILMNDKIDKIKSSPTGKYVWIYSKLSGKSFARKDVKESNNYKGTSWTEAPTDVKIADIAVGENVIWCISQLDEHVYRLKNLSQTNIIGIGWRKMPFKLKAITVDSEENRLWGIDLNNRLVIHEMDVYPRNCLVKNCTTIAKSINKRNSSTESWTDICTNTGYNLYVDN